MERECTSTESRQGFVKVAAMSFDTPFTSNKCTFGGSTPIDATCMCFDRSSRCEKFSPSSRRKCEFDIRRPRCAWFRVKLIPLVIRDRIITGVERDARLTLRWRARGVRIEII
ncbi:predicted protein [Ostreococcus lucimarinus CCE9901]|uniref:Uncharacterized protein n=1 Tax=Ostreococcus lucimarinus (strain CCE9901) TaxID=436017 RepID=A4S0N7_OSTLU|nr:predicted protein [Ostreococcus lucimarinus CCE9901]ABO97303.1 predicted protein [Ostreococcus lucimarinus CCE9901]|eukprot:XP_001419010.1 predicted protein [Ostreococcus lucimarinus CCE9901]